MFAFIHRISILMPSLAIVVVMTTKRIQVRTYVHVLTHRFLTTLFIWSLYVDSYMNRSNTFTQTRWQISLFFRTITVQRVLETANCRRRKNNNYPLFLSIEVKRKFFFLLVLLLVFSITAENYINCVCTYV